MPTSPRNFVTVPPDWVVLQKQLAEVEMYEGDLRAEAHLLADKEALMEVTAGLLVSAQKYLGFTAEASDRDAGDSAYL